MRSNSQSSIAGAWIGVAILVASLGANRGDAAVIAASIDDLRNFTYGAADLSVLTSPNRTSTSAAANFDGASTTSLADCPVPPGAGPCNPGGLTANSPQGTAGPGPFPGEDDYTQPPAGGFAGSRGDANSGLLEFVPLGTLSQNVAGSRLAAAGTGGATGSTQIFENIEIIGATGQSTPLAFSFTADPYLEVGVDAAGDIAVAILQTTFTLINSAGATVFRWSPGGDPASDIGVALANTPFSLNLALTASDPTGNQIYDPASDGFGVTTVALVPDTYTFSLSTSSIVRADSQAPTGVPEPATLLLLAIAFLVFGAGEILSRRQRAHVP